MARSSLIKVALVVALVLAAGSAFAAASVITGPTAIGSGSFVPSNNVQIGCSSGNSLFSANSKHLNGDRVIGMVSSDAKLYFSSGATVGGTVAAPAASDSYTNLSSGNGWSSL